MKRTTAWLAAALLAANVPAHAQADHEPEDHQLVAWKDLLGKGSTLQLYGFLRLDLQYDDSRFNDPQIPAYVQSEDPAAPAGVGAGEDDSEFAMHARLTRLGLNLEGPGISGLGEPDLTGNLEIDFYNIGLNDNDSRSAIRMRRAFLNLDWGDWSVLAGQEWDLISPLYPAVNHDLMMWGAGNLGDRRPQLRVQYDHAVGSGAVSFTGGIGLSGAVDSPTVENGLRAGENSGEPMLAARIGYSGRTRSEGSYQVGVSGHVSSEDFDPDGAGALTEQDFDSSSLSIDFKAPLIGNELSLLGEAFSGENMDDVRGGIFQGVNATGGEIESEGGWVELALQATPDLSLHAGYALDDPDDDDLDANGRSKNEVFYAAARRKWGVFHAGLEYLSWTTEYVGLDEGDANRLQAFLAYYF